MKDKRNIVETIFGRISPWAFRLVGIFVFLLCCASFLEAQTSKDDNTGYWVEGGTWQLGNPPVVTNLGDDVTINGFVTRDGNLSTTNNSAVSFIVNDTLVVRGNFELGNKTSLILGPNAILLVDGNYTSGSQVEVGNGGRIVVTGFIDISHSKKTEFDNDDGEIYIFDIDNSDFGNPSGPNALDAFDCNPETSCPGVGDQDEL